MPGKDKLQPHPLDASGIFLSKKSVSRFPKKTAHTLFFTATSWDHDVKVADEAGPMDRKGMQRVLEIGRHGCKIVPPPFPGTLLTKKFCRTHGTYTQKPNTDYDVNCFLAKMKKLDAAGGAQAPPLERTPATSSYGEDFKRSSVEKMLASKPGAIPPEAGQGPFTAGPLLVTSSHAHSVHSRPSDEMSATMPAFRPRDVLEGSKMNGMWQSQYDFAFSGVARENPACLPPTAGPKHRQKARRMQVGGLVADLGEELRRCHSAPTTAFVNPVSLIRGTFPGEFLLERPSH